MLKDQVLHTLRSNLNYIPTGSQEALLGQLSQFIIENNSNDILVINGYAGTGKTTLINALVKTLSFLKFKSVLLAPTGRAAKVLASYTDCQSYTIHKKIYRQKGTKDGFGQFKLDINLSSNTFFIVDEASMIGEQSRDNSIFGSGSLLSDLIEYVFNNRNCRLILVGDTAQLPPVGIENSPALNPSSLSEYGLKVQLTVLTDVIRQSKESGILYNATLIRNLLTQGKSDYPKFITNKFQDIVPLSGKEFLEELSGAYDKYGMEDVLVVCKSNKRANRYNEGIRNQILYREEKIVTGDLLMVVKNNYFWTEGREDIDFIANGDIAEILKIHKFEERYGYKFAEVSLRLLDYSNLELQTLILLDTIDIETASLPFDDNKKLYYTILEDYADIKTMKKRYQAVRQNKYFNALQVKFAYAITCHKSQGGQWSTVFIDQGYFIDDMLNTEYLRWLYTAVTRATKKLYLVNFNKKFLAEPED